MPAVDAIFFDVDGTLVDARRDIAGAMNRVLARLGYTELSVETITSFVGTGVKDLIAGSLGSSDPALIDRATELYEEEYLKAPADYATLYPGVIPTLQALAGKRKFILTNRYVHLASAMLDKLGISRYFEEVFGGDDEKCIKPSACVLGKLLPKLNIDRKRALMVGDMDIDVMTGKNSGVATCWITHGLGKSEDVLKLGPDYVIDDITELLKIVVGHT